jgi:flagellar motility protein MotE (MotC chaperone)
MIMRLRRPNGVLAFMAGMFLVSGAIRLGLGIEEARAVIPPQSDISAIPPPLSCPEPPEILVRALDNRAARISTEEARLDERAKALAVAETAARQLIDELRQAQSELAATLAQSDGAAETDLARLTAVYEAMKPKDAAALFETMAPEFSAGFLGRMRPDAAAAVLSGMTPEAAYTVSLLLAGRNAQVPRE